MSISRLLIQQGDKRYLFLKFEARPDGSLLIFLDRPQTEPKEAMIFGEKGQFVPDLNRTRTGAKVSCHTTGEIHYYNGAGRQGTFHIEPLHKLSKPYG